MSRPELPPPRPPPARQREAGTRRREECPPRSKNMSTNSKWTPGCSPPFKCGCRLSASALSPRGLREPSSLFPKKGGGRLTLRMAHGLLQESERAARRPALFRALPKCPATPLPTPVGGGRRLRLAYFVAERGDPRLSLVELLLEVAVLRKHGGAGSGQLSGGSGARGAPRAAAPRPASQAARTAPQVP